MFLSGIYGIKPWSEIIDEIVEVELEGIIRRLSLASFYQEWKFSDFCQIKQFWKLSLKFHLRESFTWYHDRSRFSEKGIVSFETFSLNLTYIPWSAQGRTQVKGRGAVRVPGPRVVPTGDPHDEDDVPAVPPRACRPQRVQHAVSTASHQYAVSVSPRTPYTLCWIWFGGGKSKVCIPPETAFALGNFRVANAKKGEQTHEMYMANTNQTLAYPTRTIFHWLMLGLALGPQGLALGLQGLALGPWGFSDTNVLVSAKRIARVGGRTQRKDPTRVVSRCSEI